MLSISIDRNCAKPVYEQLAEQVRELVASGMLQPETALPPVRQLARDLGVNLNTVARGYRLLQSEGFLEIRDRAGVVVAAPEKRIAPAARDELLRQLRTTLARLRQAGMQQDELLLATREAVLAWDSDKEQTQ